VQTSTCLQPVVVFVGALPNFVVPLASVLVSSLQSSFMIHTSWRQLEDELDVLENIDELELESGELEEDGVRSKEKLDLSTSEDKGEEESVSENEEELDDDDISIPEDEDEEDSVRDNGEELDDEDDISTIEGKSGEDGEDRVDDINELVDDEDELKALEEELSTLPREEEEEHEA